LLVLQGYHGPQEQDDQNTECNIIERCHGTAITAAICNAHYKTKRRSGLAQQKLRQHRHIDRNPPRLIFGERLGPSFALCGPRLLTAIRSLPYRLAIFFETLENKAYAHRRKVAEKRKEQSRRGYKEKTLPTRRRLEPEQKG
jgi:hypothetical protein